MATHSRFLAWRIPWTEEPGGLWSMGSQRVGHFWATNHWTTREFPSACSSALLHQSHLFPIYLIYSFLEAGYSLGKEISRNHPPKAVCFSSEGKETDFLDPLPSFILEAQRMCEWSLWWNWGMLSTPYSIGGTHEAGSNSQDFNSLIVFKLKKLKRKEMGIFLR